MESKTHWAVEWFYDMNPERIAFKPNQDKVKDVKLKGETIDQYYIIGDSKGYEHFEIMYEYDRNRFGQQQNSIRYWSSLT